VALNGQKGYHGVAIISKLPFEYRHPPSATDRFPSRLGWVWRKARLSSRWCCIISTFRRRHIDPALNRNSSTNTIPRRDESVRPLHPRGNDRHAVGDLNVAPHENDV
jgi:exodeoxyribonuclease-3